MRREVDVSEEERTARLKRVESVRGFTPLCPTWAALIVTDLSCLHSGVHQRCGPTRCEIERVEMNLVVIEEHQVGDLVFAQLEYLYISLRPHWPMLSYQ